MSLTISVITPSFNSADYIDRAIKSVIQQGYSEMEHIVVDAGSADGTLALLQKYQHLKWISEADRGQSDAMNKGFKLSTGEIVSYLNADDYFHPGVFNKVSKYFRDHPEIDMVIGDIQINLPDRSSIIRTPSIQYNEIVQYWKDLFPANPVSYFYRRKVQSAFGLFSLDNECTMDLDFLFFAYKYFKVGYLSECFGVFDMHGQNKTSKMDIRVEQKKSLMNFYRKHDKVSFIKQFLSDKVKTISKWGIR